MYVKKLLGMGGHPTACIIGANRQAASDCKKGMWDLALVVESGHAHTHARTRAHTPTHVHTRTRAYLPQGSYTASTQRKGTLLVSKAIPSPFEKKKGHLPTRTTDRLTQSLFPILKNLFTKTGMWVLGPTNRPP